MRHAMDWLLARTKRLFSPAVAPAKGAKDAFDQAVEAYANNDFDLAVRRFTEAIRLKPEFVAAYCNRGAAYESKGDHDKAIADLTEAIRFKPNDALAFHAFYNRGIAYAGQTRARQYRLRTAPLPFASNRTTLRSIVSVESPTRERVSMTKRSRTAPRPSA